MDKLFVDGYMILKNVVDKNDIDKLLNSLDEYDLEPRTDIEFKEENNETLLSQKMNLNEKIKVKSMLDYLDKKIFVQQFFWNDMSTVRLSDFKSAYKSVLDIYNKKEVKETANVQTYLPGSFIKKHDDGIVKDRFAVVLIPLNSKPKGASGGDLILYTKEDKEIVIESNKGDVVILDFTQNNLKHQVTTVEDWCRVSFVSFLFNC